MNKRIVHTILLFLILFSITGPGSFAQQKRKSFRELMHGKRSIEKTEQSKGTSSPQQKTGCYMNYDVINGDTVYLDVIQPTWIFAKSKGKKSRDWRRYYRLVYNFNIVYPYALAARTVVGEVDSTITAEHFNRIQKERYIRRMQNDLLRTFGPTFKHMTISQGVLLVKLVDREIGRSSYSVIKDYKNGIAAGFWQGIAKIFGNNLKNQYDPAGADKTVEELVKKWESGQFDAFYYSIFWEYPPHANIPSKYR